jgi:hypothetical protein
LRKVIYVSFGRLTDKFARDWYIDYLIAKGATVEYWDVVALLREDHLERTAAAASYLRALKSFAELETLLLRADNRDALYVMLISYSGRFTRIFRLLSKYDCRMLSFAWGALPHDPVYKWRKIVAWLRVPARLLREVAGTSKAAMLRKLNLVKPFAVTFAAGGASMASSSHAARVVPINYFDYDLYLKAQKDARRLVTGRYAVFLDINLPHHSDLALVGYPRIDASSYYRSLNRFFGLLERQLEVAVVIAAHPRADYDGSTFEGRQVLRLVTAELVRDCEFVMSHTSTAMSYAVLNSKPLIFIHTDEMAVVYRHKFIREMRCYADCLDAPMYSIDKVQSASDVVVKPVNQRCYERYKYQFLTSPESENTPTQEIFWREISA